MSQVAIVIPLMRANKIAPLVENIAETTQDYETIVVATGECADAARDLPVTLVEDAGGTWPQRICAGYAVSQSNYLMTGADDIWFLPGWFEAALLTMNSLPNGSGVIGINDCYNPIGNHFLMSKDYIETFGGAMNEPGVPVCTAYQHQYADDDLRATAKFHGRWAMSMDSKIEHRHVGAGKADMDETYRIGEATAGQGYAIVHSRAHLWESATQ